MLPLKKDIFHIDRRNDLEDRQLSLNDRQNLCSSRPHSYNGLGSEDNICKLDTFSSKGIDAHCRKSSTPTEVRGEDVIIKYILSLLYILSLCCTGFQKTF